MKRAIDWKAHARALRKGKETVALTAPSPTEVESVPHVAMQLAAWGVPWPPPKGWKFRLAKLYYDQQVAKKGVKR